MRTVFTWLAFTGICVLLGQFGHGRPSDVLEFFISSIATFGMVSAFLEDLRAVFGEK